MQLTALVVHAEWPTDRIELTTLNTKSSQTDNVGCPYVHIFQWLSYLVVEPITTATERQFSHPTIRDNTHA